MIEEKELGSVLVKGRANVRVGRENARESAGKVQSVVNPSYGCRCLLKELRVVRGWVVLAVRG